MKKKKVIGFLIAGILIVIGAIIIRFLNKRVEITENIEDEESVENIEDAEGIESEERTDEEYISILLDNKEDFDYVAEMMCRWDEGSIDFENGIIANRNQELADEISNNEEFYGHLKNLMDLGEVYYILMKKYLNPPSEMGDRAKP